MLAFASYLFGQGASHVAIHPDGMHGKQFEIGGWLVANGFRLTHAAGRTAYGGLYTFGNKTLEVRAKGGLGDVEALVDGKKVVAECKGGVFNSTHNGVRSSLRSGLREALGSLLERPLDERHFAIVPDSAETRRFAEKAIVRAELAGIGIALITDAGRVHFIGQLKI